MDTGAWIAMICLLGIAFYKFGGVSWLLSLIIGGLSEPEPPLDDTLFKEYCASLNSMEMRNLIISGGRSSDRYSAIMRVVNEANRREIPAIVLHSGFAQFNQFTQNTYFDPCIDTDSDEIAEILTDAATNALNIDSVVHVSIKFIVDVLKATTGDIILSDVVKFPCDDVIGYLDDRKEDSSINDNQYDRFKQRYNNPAIKDNILRVSQLFAKLKAISQRSQLAQPISFQQAVMNREILFFDLLSDTNEVLKEMIFSAISKATEYSKFWVITEGISFMDNENSKVNAVFTKNRNNISLIFSDADVPARTAKKEDYFKTLVGGNSQMLLFTHSSGSAAKLAEYFGAEFQEKVTLSSMNGSSESTSSSFLSFSTNTTGSMSSSGKSVGAERVHIHPQQTFMHSSRTKDINNNTVILGLNEGECYFVDSSMGHYDLPKIVLSEVQPLAIEADSSSNTNYIDE